MVLDAPSTSALEAAVVAAKEASLLPEGPPLLVLLTSCTKEAAQLAGECALVVDVLMRRSRQSSPR